MPSQLDVDKIRHTNGTDALTFDTSGNTNLQKDLKFSSTAAIKNSAGNNILSESGGTITLTTNSAVIEGSSGRLLVGYDSSVDTRNYLNNSLGGPTFQQHGTTQGSSNAAIYSWVNNSFAPSALVLNKSISGTIGTRGALTAINTDIGAIVFAGDDGTNFIPAAAILAEVDGTPGTNDMPGRLVFSTTADGASNPNERMRIDSSGNVGIGTSTVARGPLHIHEGSAADTQIHLTNNTSGSGNTDGTTIYTTGVNAGIFHRENGYFSIATNSTDRMRIDSSGNLLVRTNSASASTGVGIKLLYSSPQISVTTDNPSNGVTAYTLYNMNATNNGYRFYVTTQGIIHAITTTISGISDQRLKENIRDLDVGLTEILQLQPRVFDWKVGKGKDVRNDRGFIAQEFEQIFPDLVDEWKDPAPEGEESYKSVRQDLIPVLVKAIQEQQTIIESQQSQIDTLTIKTQEQDLTIASLISRIEALETN